MPEAYIVYDQPPEFFRCPTLPERHELFVRLRRTSADFADAVRALSTASSGGARGGGPEGIGGGDAAAAAAAAAPEEDGGGDDRRPDDEPRPRPKKTRSSGSGRRGGGDSGGEPGDDGAEARPPSAVGPPGVKEGGDGGGREGAGDEQEQDRTLFTTRSAEGVYELRRDRPALLVSSTSWTPDEDFSVLLEALRRFDSRTASGASPTLPTVMVVVTGKGPDKAKYVERMKAARMTRVAVCTAWLEPQDYPVLLGSADLGICLHTSTSGEGSWGG